MDKIRIFCTLPQPLLSNIGAVLVADLRSVAIIPATSADVVPTPAGDEFHQLLSRISPILYANEFLFLVFISESFDDIEAARHKLNEDLQCKMIGGVYCERDMQAQNAYLTWARKFSPRSPFILMNDSLLKTHKFQSRTIKAALFSKRPDGYKLQNFPQRPVLDRPLKSTELFALAIEAYAHGLPSVAFALAKPLADYWNINPASDRGKLGIMISHNRNMSGMFGELNRRLNIHLLRTEGCE